MARFYNIPKDKIYHAAAGAIASAVVFCVTSNPWLGLAAAVVAGVAKEFWDSKGHGTVDVWDFVATTAGGTVASLVCMIFIF